MEQVWPYGDPRKVESVPYQLRLYIGGGYILVFYVNGMEKGVLRARSK